MSSTQAGFRFHCYGTARDTNDADDVGDWLQKKYPSEFGGDKLLIIHTDKSGEVSKKDLDKRE